MAPKHTPGPWMADEDALVGTPDRHVCTVGDDGPLTDEDHANAELIALAPAMELVLWANAASDGSSADDSCWEFSFPDIDGEPQWATVPMLGHLPHTRHIAWPSARNALLAIRAKMEAA